ncbi:MAG TPA: 23S rRNA (uracil(1939)-C(5))-methyltransferase RlmD [Candidatus Dorea intestinavium]|nr:23S rRNA (uracil(1939)-C(5))-methyltransferase RlmD [Candidatus Dorea intestinavium]
MKKNEIVTLTIEDIGINGEGIGKVMNYPLFIKDAIVGDKIKARVIKAKKNYGYGRIEEIIEPSKDRVVPPCFIAEKCGGCQIQALSYEKQLEFKYNKVKQNLKRIGQVKEEVLDLVMEDIRGMKEPFRYRNKAAYPIGRNKEGKLMAGFYAGRTHSIIPVEDCLVGQEVNKEILKTILTFMQNHQIEPYNEQTQKGVLRHVLIRYGEATGEIMVCLIINAKSLKDSDKLVVELQKIAGIKSISLNINRENTNVIMGEKTLTLWGSPTITDYIGEVKFQISPKSFYQVNPAQTKVLYDLALEMADLSGKETVWDLYCGIGTISLFLSKKAKMVYGVEIVPQAIADAKENARINQIENAKFFVGKAEEVVPREQEKYGRAEVIVVDPPRKGLDETLIATMAQMSPDRIVYVSCDSATMARDVALLSEKGYELKRVVPVDQFPQTVHVETVVLITRNI